MSHTPGHCRTSVTSRQGQPLPDREKPTTLSGRANGKNAKCYGGAMNSFALSFDSASSFLLDRAAKCPRMAARRVGTGKPACWPWDGSDELAWVWALSWPSWESWPWDGSLLPLLRLVR